MKHFWVSRDGIYSVVEATNVKSAICAWINQQSRPSFNPNVDEILKFETAKIKDLDDFERRQTEGECGPPLDECTNYYLATDTVAWNLYQTVDDAQHSDPYFAKVK